MGLNRVLSTLVVAVPQILAQTVTPFVIDGPLSG